MAQVDTNSHIDDVEITIQAKNVGIATTASFVTLLDIDTRLAQSSHIIIHNVTTGDLDYQVLATTEDYDTVVLPTGTNDDDKGWIVDTTASAATGTAPDNFNINNVYSRVIVQVKHTTLTTNVSAWYRGTQ